MVCTSPTVINELQGVADCNIVLEVMLGATVYVLEVMKSSFSFAWRVSASPAFSLLHIPPLLKCSVEANTAIQYCTLTHVTIPRENGIKSILFFCLLYKIIYLM